MTAGADLRINGDSGTGNYCYQEETYTLHKGEIAQICYKVTNPSSFTDLLSHTLVSSERGGLLTNFPFTLIPGASIFLNEWSNNVNSSFTETATWSTEAAEDTSSVTVDAVGVTCPADKPLTQKYSFDFEADNGSAVGSNDWEWGSIPEVYPPRHSGNNVWATVLDGPYNNLNDHSLLTFEIDLRKISPPVGLLWKQSLQANGSGFDFAKITANGDVVYTSFGIPDEPYWTLHYANLDAYAGGHVTLIFDFYATSVSNDEGWYIDDLTIEHCYEPPSSILNVLYYPILTGATAK